MRSALDIDPLAAMDEETKAKCVFLDIEIAINRDKDFTDIKIGELYIRKASTHQMLVNSGMMTKVVKFRSADEALRFYVDHVGSDAVTWGTEHKHD